MTTTDYSPEQPDLAVARPASAHDPEVVLSVEDLTVGFPTEDGLVRAVRGVSYEVRKGEALGIVGESGSGKSVTSLAVMGLLPRTAKITGSAKVVGQEMLGLNDEEISKIRGNRVAMIFQDPLTSLNPVYTVGKQLVEAVQVHNDISDEQAHQRAIELLNLVGIPYPEQRVHAYPHELSGGMRQRVVIGIAMANNPDVIIADEPTTALDVTVQAQILDLMRDLQEEFNSALIVITHDLGVVAELVDEVLVMYGGRCVEQGAAEIVFNAAQHPYTWGLLGSMPRLDRHVRDRLIPIRGTPPSLITPPPGCVFHPRCPYAERDGIPCRTVVPELLAVDRHDHQVACHLPAAVRQEIFTTDIGPKL